MANYFNCRKQIIQYVNSTYFLNPLKCQRLFNRVPYVIYLPEPKTQFPFFSRIEWKTQPDKGIVTTLFLKRSVVQTGTPLWPHGALVSGTQIPQVGATRASEAPAALSSEGPCQRTCGSTQHPRKRAEWRDPLNQFWPPFLSSVFAGADGTVLSLLMWVIVPLVPWRWESTIHQEALLNSWGTAFVFISGFANVWKYSKICLHYVQGQSVIS